MSISPFFRTLRTAYQAEIDDLAFDSEGNNVLRTRLAQRRKEMGFLLQMMELSPEMVAVVFHQAFRFALPGAMDHLISHDSEDLPEWDSLAGAITLAPWANDLAQQVLQQPKGEWFLAVAAGLEYMYAKVDHSQQAEPASDEEDKDSEEASSKDSGDSERGQLDSDDATDAPKGEGEDAGADWMEAQGFDRKD